MNEHIDLVRKSFERLSPEMDRVGERFFENLLSRDNSLKTIIDRADRATLRSTLGSGLTAVIANLDRPLVLESILYEIGRRHRMVGVRPDQLGIALDALLFAVRDVYAGEWDSDLESAWVDAATVIMDHMQRGLQNVRPPKAS
jgi:nitric oxide dioxygenase